MRLSLYVHGLRAAQARQLRSRALRPLRRRRFPDSPPPSLEPPTGPAELWRSAAFEQTPLAGSGDERLRVFHAHYGEDALRCAREGDAAGAREAMERWIALHPPQPGDPWHPYPLSTRAGNWIAALALAPEAASGRVRESLWRQLRHLAVNVEEDVLGNHLIRNARALVLGGAAFGSAELLERGAELLERELPVQVLPDGGHYERSPVYHLVVLRDLLEVAAVADVPGMEGAIERMRAFAAALRRPDGAPALFNDGGLDLAPELDLPAPPEGLTVFAETGYATLRTAALWLAFDCGPPAPPYLPAHAHADALSFQLWLGGRPLVVDPGMPTYEPGAERDWFRGTRAHSTVAVGGDQFELWKAFRAGPLPEVRLLHATAERLEASVTGRAGATHRRTIEIGSGRIEVHDVIDGRGRHGVESALPLAPGAPLDAAGPRGDAIVERRVVAERLYERVDADALVRRRDVSLPHETGWSLGTG